MEGLINYQNTVMVGCLVTEPNRTITEVMRTLSKVDTFCTQLPHCERELTMLTLLRHRAQLN